ncbi:CBS domain-containing protein [Thiothrix caldifontis]|uniref:CBS domain-containing protein n=2 Tax=Thiothrix caldifontis TaxID=525918 RepID=A0A1H4AY21_9GAMM|nr:CBS domain-containing protein [Thiothrix caldifontis]
MIISSVEKLIDGKSPGQVQSDITIREACKRMCELDVGALAVFDQQLLVGILSERDVIRRCLGTDRFVDETDVAAIMTQTPITIDAGSSLANALEVMQSGGFHHLPVTKDGQLIGLLALDDIPEEYHLLLEQFKELRAR